MRTIPPAMAAALAAGTVMPHILAELQFDSATVRLTDIPYSVTWGGHEWTGAGQFAGIEAIREGGQIQAQDLTATLSGVPLGLIALALAEPPTDRPFVLYLATLDPVTHVLVDAVELWGGRMDVMSIVEDAETATIAIRLEHEMSEWDKAPGGKYTHEDQQMRFPDCKGLEYIAKVATETPIWPNKEWRP